MKAASQTLLNHSEFQAYVTYILSSEWVPAPRGPRASAHGVNV